MALNPRCPLDRASWGFPGRREAAGPARRQPLMTLGFVLAVLFRHVPMMAPEQKARQQHQEHGEEQDQHGG